MDQPVVGLVVRKCFSGIARAPATPTGGPVEPVVWPQMCKKRIERQLGRTAPTLEPVDQPAVGLVGPRHLQPLPVCHWNQWSSLRCAIRPQTEHARRLGRFRFGRPCQVRVDRALPREVDGYFSWILDE